MPATAESRTNPIQLEFSRQTSSIELRESTVSGVACAAVVARSGGRRLAGVALRAPVPAANQQQTSRKQRQCDKLVDGLKERKHARCLGLTGRTADRRTPCAGNCTSSCRPTVICSPQDPISLAYGSRWKRVWQAHRAHSEAVARARSEAVLALRLRRDGRKISANDSQWRAEEHTRMAANSGKKK